MTERAARLLQSAAAHEAAARRHRIAAERWADEGDQELARIELQWVVIEQLAAELERDRADLLRARGQA